MKLLSMTKHIITMTLRPWDQNLVIKIKIHFHINFFLIFLLSFISIDQLPFSIRILLESAVRNCDNFQVLEKDVNNILEWKDSKGETNDKDVEVSFKPARVILQVIYNLFIPFDWVLRFYEMHMQ